MASVPAANTAAAHLPPLQTDLDDVTGDAGNRRSGRRRPSRGGAVSLDDPLNMASPGGSVDSIIAAAAATEHAGMALPTGAVGTITTTAAAAAAAGGGRTRKRRLFTAAADDATPSDDDEDYTEGPPKRRVAPKRRTKRGGAAAGGGGAGGKPPSTPGSARRRGRGGSAAGTPRRRGRGGGAGASTPRKASPAGLGIAGGGQAEQPDPALVTHTAVFGDILGSAAGGAGAGAGAGVGSGPAGGMVGGNGAVTASHVPAGLGVVPPTSATALARAVSTKLRRFANAEWAYSGIDRGYFLRNEFRECLVEMSINVDTLTRTEWGAVRSAMGRPRRLSPSFLLEERRKLARYRADVRLVQQGKTPCHSLVDGPFVYQVPRPLVVGQRVSAIHPMTLALAQGSVLTVDSIRGQYRVQFDRADAGVHLIEDTSIMPHGTVPLLYPALCTAAPAVPVVAGGAAQPVVTSHAPHDGWVLGVGMGLDPEDDATPLVMPQPANAHANMVVGVDTGMGAGGGGAGAGAAGGAGAGAGAGAGNGTTAGPTSIPTIAAAAGTPAIATGAVGVGGAGGGGGGAYPSGTPSNDLLHLRPSASPRGTTLADLKLPPPTISPPELAILRADQVRVMATLSKLLSRKEMLLQELAKLNARAAKMGGVYSPQFQHGYTWVIVALEATNNSIDPARAAMRLLSHQQQVLSQRRGGAGSGGGFAVAPDSPAVLGAKAQAIVDDPSGSSAGSLDAGSLERLRFGSRQATQTANVMVGHTLPVAVQVRASVLKYEDEVSRGVSGASAALVPIAADLPQQVWTTYTRQVALVQNAMALLCGIHWCSQERLSRWEIYTFLERQLAQLRPVHSANDGLFRDLEVAVAMLRACRHT